MPFTTDLLHNPMFSGGFALGAMGAATMWLRSIWGTAKSFMWRRLITTVEIREDDSSFGYVEEWLNNHPYADKNKMIGVKTTWSKGVLPIFMLLPSPGSHMFWDNRRVFWISKNRDKIDNPGYSNKAYTDTLYIRTLFGSKAFFDSFLHKCYQDHEKKEIKTINVKYHAGNYWETCNTKDQSKPNRLVLTPEHEDVVKDIERFISAKEWYEDVGIPWRRGYLFHGEPGNGKSSLIIEIAKKIGYNVYFLSLTGKDISDSKLIDMLSGAGSSSIVVIEEIDTVFNKRTKVAEGEAEVPLDAVPAPSSLSKSEKSTGGITFGGLLNVLDGVVAKEGRIIIMTTNHPDRLDPALIRPGRVDKKVYFPNATEAQIAGMLNRFFPGKDIEALVANLVTKKPSMALMQELCIGYKDNFEALEAEIEVAYTFATT
jgi:chaperone BCS1